MRAWVWVGGLVGWVGIAGIAGAQTASFDAKVRVPAAEVRGGPSNVFDPIGRLRQGQPVHVVGEEDGYWRITPPPGSSSWIEDGALQRPPERGRPSDVMVLLNNAPIRLGSSDLPNPHQVERTTLARGTIVHAFGESVLVEGKRWWRIQPAPAEVRYVAKEALDQPQPKTKVSASIGTDGTGPTTANRPAPTLWVQAEQAERAGDLNRAELLYRQLYSDAARPGGDHDLARHCSERIDRLSRLRAQVVPWPARQPAPGILVSGNARPTPAPSTAPPPPLPAGAVASGPGWLRRSGVPIDGRSAYVLEDNRGQLRYYLLAQTGLNLEMFVNRPVEVYGPLVQRTDLAGGSYMSVNRLHLLR